MFMRRRKLVILLKRSSKKRSAKMATEYGIWVVRGYL
jgi:hypothetical protein